MIVGALFSPLDLTRGDCCASQVAAADTKRHERTESVNSIIVKDWGPDGIADLSARAVRVAFRRLRRVLPGAPELRRFGIMSDHWRDYIAGVVVTNLHRPETRTAPARQIIRQLSTIVLRRCLEAERKTTARRKVRALAPL